MKYEIEVLIEVDTDAPGALILPSEIDEEAVYEVVDAIMQRAHKDDTVRVGGFPGWHYQLLEGCVAEVTP